MPEYGNEEDLRGSMIRSCIDVCICAVGVIEHVDCCYVENFMLV